MDIYFDQSLNRKLSVVKLSKQTLGCPSPPSKLSVVKLSVVKLSKQTLGCPPSLLERAVIMDNSADCFPSSRVHPCNAQPHCRPGAGAARPAPRRLAAPRGHDEVCREGPRAASSHPGSEAGERR